MLAYIFRGELHDFADSHAPPGHQFQDKPVAELRRPEDDLIDCLLFDNIPVYGFSGPVDLPQRGCVTRILNGRFEIGLDEIEEGLEVGVPAVLGLMLSALSDFVKKREDLLGCDGSKIAIIAKVVIVLGSHPQAMAKVGTPVIDSCPSVRYNNANCDTRRPIHMPVSLRVPPEKAERIRIAAGKAGMSKTAFILEAIDEKLGVAKNREQTIRELAGWMSHEEAAELREALKVFEEIHGGDWA